MILTVRQVAERLEISPSRVRKLIRDGRLPATKHGRDWAIEQSSLDSFIKVPRRAGRPRGTQNESVSFPPSPSEVLLCPNGHRLCRDSECWKK